MARNADGTGSEKRVTTRIVRALECMIQQGKSRADAAAAAGLKERSLIVALRKPHVRAFRTGLMRTHIDVEAERSVAVMVHLRDHSTSDHVRLDAATRIAALGGIRPPTDPSFNINIGGPAGWIIDLTPPPTPAIEANGALLDARGEPAAPAT